MQNIHELNVRWHKIDENEDICPNEPVFIYFSGNGSIEVYDGAKLYMPLTDGFDADGNQKYVPNYQVIGFGNEVTHWAIIPEVGDDWHKSSDERPPDEDDCVVIKVNDENVMVHSQDYFWQEKDSWPMCLWCPMPSNAPADF